MVHRAGIRYNNMADANMALAELEAENANLKQQIVIHVEIARAAADDSVRLQGQITDMRAALDISSTEGTKTFWRAKEAEVKNVKLQGQIDTLIDVTRQAALLGSTSGLSKLFDWHGKFIEGDK